MEIINNKIVRFSC